MASIYQDIAFILYIAILAACSATKINAHGRLRIREKKDMAHTDSLKGYVINIEKATLENQFFRKVLYTAKNSQLVLMSIAPLSEIGEEIHSLDQFIRIESGLGKVVINGIEHPISDGTAIVIPAGARHNVVNESNTDAIKLYSVYSPPEHKDGVIHRTKEDALTSEEHFDGSTTEQ